MRIGGIPVWLILVVAALAAGPARAGEEGEAAPAGLAAKHPGDQGLAEEPAVIFLENFEQGSLAEIGRRWNDVSNRDEAPLALSDESPPGSPGARSLRVTATLGENTGGHLYRRFPEGVDLAFARFYVRFAPDAGYIHHFVTLGGYNPPTNWPQGGAGECPRGDDRVTVGIEPWGDWGRHPAPGAWHFYAYWHQMKAAPDGRYWGNGFDPDPPAQVPRGQWQCVEFMIRLNSAPDRDDGELALWLDGTERGRWDGFHWRSSPDLKLNFFWLMHYVTENAPRQNHVENPPRQTTVFFDHVVVAREYVGPLVPAPAAEPDGEETAAEAD